MFEVKKKFSTVKDFTSDRFNGVKDFTSDRFNGVKDFTSKKLRFVNKKNVLLTVRFCMFASCCYFFPQISLFVILGYLILSILVIVSLILSCSDIFTS